MSIYKLLYKWEVSGGREAANVLYWNNNGDIPTVPDDPEATASWALGQWEIAIVPLASGSTIFRGVTVSRIDGTGQFERSVSVGGGGSGASSPPNVAYLVRKNVFESSRGGRLYLPGVAESQVDDAGNIPGGIVTAINAQFDGYWNGMTEGLTRLVIQRKGPGGIGSETYHPITGFVCDTKVATMRRRLRG